MKRAYCALTVSLVSGCAFAQSAVPPRQLPPGAIVFTPSAAPARLGPPAPQSFTPGQKHRYGTVQTYLTFPSPLQWGDSLLAAMGDEAARDVLMILSTVPPLSAGQMQTAMDIVHKSFMSPRAVTNVADLKPTASLALLQKFQATATDQLVKERIAAENNFLNAVPQALPPLTLPANVPEGPNPFPGTQVTRGSAAH